ncbi:Ig-like domain-containing protein [Candidatus Oscillochloris fontis]|uniref:Ig-like domain-containing protein n=1 Tax=Candidatus Oscillochloris fontis TaxID=2496868 RepID=UPI00101BB5B0|nr:Ig-like domain-containing protein [Candidatus Oscillochloris fontis]
MSRFRSLLSVRGGMIALAILVVVGLAGGGIMVGPQLLRGPQVLIVTPPDGADHANPQSPIIMRFDQAVQAASLNDAIQFEPAAPFTVSVDGPVVTIQPTEGLTYGADYRLTITGITNQFGRAMEQPLTLRFTTQPYVAVERVLPDASAEAIAPNAPLILVFDEMVVPAEQVRAAAEDPRLVANLPHPLQIEPPVEGAGQWLSPTRYSFAPTGGWATATTYTITVPQQVSADGLARMEQPFSWSFSTKASLLATTRPFDQEQEVVPNRPVEVQMARGVDVASAAANFSLIDVATNQPVAGTVETQDDRFIFQPTQALNRGGRYQAVLASGVQAASGKPINAEPLSWEFQVIGDLAIAQVIPAADTTEVVTATQQIAVHFNHPVVPVVTPSEQDSLPQPLTISPPVAGVGRWIDTSTYIISPTTSLDPATRYTVSIAAGLNDQTGGTLRDGFSWSFTTIAPLVYGSLPPSGARFADPNATFSLVFNQPMDMASLNGAVRLLDPNGVSVPGSIAVASKPASVFYQAGQDSNNPMRSGFTVTFTPAAPLTRGQSYTLVVGTEARAVNGGAALGQAYSASLIVAPLPALLESYPPQGNQQVNPNDSLSLTFTTPMDWASVEQNLSIIPAPTSVYTGTYDNQLYLYFPLQAESDYTVRVGAAAKDTYGVALGQDVVLSFRTMAMLPSLTIAASNSLMTYSSYAPVRVPIQTVNTEQVEYALYRVSRGELAQLIPATQNFEQWNQFSPDPAAQILSNTLAPQGPRNRVNLSLVEVGTLDPGPYLLEVRGANRVERQLMLVSPTTLTIKRSADRLFVWAVDLATGKPTSGLPLEVSSLFYGDNLMKLGAVEDLGATDADGVVQAEFAAASPYDALYVWTAEGTPFAFGSTLWADGISPWNFSLPGSQEQVVAVGNLSTDRPLYRPGELVHIKGVLRLNDDGRYRIPEDYQQAKLTISDPDGNQVYAGTLSLSEMGTFDLDLPLSGDALLGSYFMGVELEGEVTAYVTYGSFTVAEYRKPVFEITVDAARDDLLVGEALEVTATARYFAGGVLANAPLRWRLLTRPYYFNSETAPDYQFENLDDAYAFYRWFDMERPAAGEMLAEGTATTDAQGRFVLKLPAGTVKDLHSQNLTVDIEVTDIDGQVIAAQGGMTMHAGAFYIGLRPNGYVSQIGQPQAVDLITLDPQGAPVAGRSVEVGIYQREWYSVREQGPDGQFYFTSAYTDTLTQTIPATTDDKGRSQISFTPREAGSYRIGATGKDDGGRTVQASAFVWVAGGDAFWGINDNNRVDLIADRTSYKPGDTAKILVTAPYKGSTALLTIEQAQVISHRIITLSGTSELIEVPISAEYAPNVYVSLVLITPAGDGTSAEAPAIPDMRMGLVNLPVSTEQQELTITISPDKSEVGPRDRVTYTISTQDYTGQGVPAEVTLALVDKAILSLANDPNPSLRQSFYERRPLGVFTSQSLIALGERVTAALGDEAKGGGGGLSETALVRRNFPDTAYWNAALITGADGTAQISVTLPDNLTTWRMSARGITSATLVGQTSADIVATRPLLVRASMPRFLTDGDAPTLQAVVQNSTANPLEATVSLGLSGPISLQDPATQTVSVPANGQTLVRWRATVAGAGDVTVRLSVDGGGMQDALETSLPVQRYETPEVTASAGQVLDLTVETLRPPPGDASRGEVSLELAPSLAAGVQGGLEYLQTFPYACTEQVVSAFLPNAVTYRITKELGVENAELQANLSAQINTGMQRIAQLQHLDGGWGWWADDASHPYLTAYVIQGLHEAERAGFSVDQNVLGGGMAYLKVFMNQHPGLNPNSMLPDASWLNTRAYILFIMAERGQADRGRSVALYDERAKLDLYGRAYLLMTLQTLGDQDRAQALADELSSAAIMRSTDAHWEEDRADYWTMGSDTRTTALMLQALVRTQPESILVPNAVRYLMSLREHGHWASTQETAVTLLALSEYLAQSGELEANYSYRVALNDTSLHEGSVDRSNLNTPIEILVKLTDLAQGSDSQLSIQRQGGAGRLYYTLRMRSYADAASVQPLDQGVSVAREYVLVDSATLSPTGQLTNQATLGELVQVRITLTVPEDMPYFMVEDMLPAGLEALDTSLKTSSAAAREPGLADAEGTQPGWWYFGRSEMRDNRVALFATNLPRGSYTYTYLARATTPGVFQVLPATAMRTYAPEVFGRSAGAEFTVVAP